MYKFDNNLRFIIYLKLIMMATEKLKELSIDQLKKKEQVDNKVLIIAPIIFLVCLTGLIIINPVFTGAAIPILAPAIISFRSRKRIREELKRRENID